MLPPGLSPGACWSNVWIVKEELQEVEQDLPFPCLKPKPREMSCGGTAMRPRETKSHRQNNGATWSCLLGQKFTSLEIDLTGGKGHFNTRATSEAMKKVTCWKRTVNYERKHQVDECRCNPWARPQSSHTFRLVLGCRFLRSTEAPCTTPEGLKHVSLAPLAELPSKEPTATEGAWSKLLGISPWIAYAKFHENSLKSRWQHSGTICFIAAEGELFGVA